MATTDAGPKRTDARLQRPDVETDVEAAKAFMVLAELLEARLHEVVAARDITPPQGHLLFAAEAGMSMRELADRLGCDPSNITGLADRLEQRGLVERRPSPSDRRVTELVRTEEGEAFLAELQEELFADLPIYRGLSGGERGELQRLLAKVVAHQDVDAPCGQQVGSPPGAVTRSTKTPST